MSATATMALPPFASISRLFASASSRELRTLRTTAAPSAASAIAVARPERRAAPVISATRPASGRASDAVVIENVS
jgi:hypothetical protein